MIRFVKSSWVIQHALIFLLLSPALEILYDTFTCFNHMVYKKNSKVSSSTENRITLCISPVFYFVLPYFPGI